MFTCRHAFPGRQSIQKVLLQRLGDWGRSWARKPWWGRGRLRRGQAGSLPGLGGWPGLCERSGQRGRGWKGVECPQGVLAWGGWGHLARGAGQSIWGGGAGRGGRQANRRWLTCGLVGHPARLGVRDLGRHRGQLLGTWEHTTVTLLSLFKS